MIDPWLTAVFASRAQRRAFGQGVGIFVLHKTGHAPGNTIDPFDYIAPDRFRARLTELREKGSAHIGELDVLTTETQRPRGFAITFDDGYADTVTTAMPVLNELGLHATVYVVADKLGKTNDWSVRKGDADVSLADKSLLQEWLSEGHMIGSHTNTHPHLRKCSLCEAREEIVASRKKLEDVFGCSIPHFAYPYGIYDERALELVREAGYVTAVTVKYGIVRPGINRFELPRMPMLTSLEWALKAWHRARRKLST
jgi:peptidoglycan/xylan/chitin deacetylase (PgdA/CDA1 family)